ncbi:hypothetical protein SAMN06265375_102245 [Muriicola jejuensis]|uniref:Anti-sigma factor n=1 Tax=Muriicola jejuensis TaxID=504488 RepID=A0A6P0UC10_9FLAO|nr:hypothetical protein [Muriicola jejuensis]NER10774.1 hypothetical protein [Muriicola jejuensis]SMP16307.1 hypothetical protein SAMN06265375_102245 [Muriicola jejuensis]
MKQDLRTLFEAERNKKHKMREGHEIRFEQKLDEAFPQRRSSFYYLMGMAASVVILMGLGFVFFQQMQTEVPVKTTVIDQQPVAQEPKGISLGDLSPDLRKVETYYVNSINLELSRLDLSEDNKEVVDDFMDRLAELNAEYQSLNRELNEIGPNEQTIEALIRNLQMRLQLLLKLKDKLNHLKSSNNETVTNNTV